MQVFTTVFKKYTQNRLIQLEKYNAEADQIQMQTFEYLIEKAKETQWGKLHGYESIRSISDFQQRVAVRGYEGLEPFINRIRKGEDNVLWPGKIKWFAKSSGTTNDKSKYIPITEDGLDKCHFQGGRDVLTIFIKNHPESKLLNGKGLVIGGSQQLNIYNNEIYYGDLSAVLMSNMPFWAQYFRTPDLSIALMSEWEEKLQRMAVATIKENVTNISGVPSWTLVLIKKILELTGKNNLMDVWPNLEVFIHGGVSFTPYCEQYKKLIVSDKMNYMETYNASEGFFSLQNDPSSNDMLLMLDYGIFYEFIPMDQIDNENPKALSIGEVELGKNYAMVISTNCGLWRYLIGDTIIFTSINPYKIKITGRTKHFINAFGEVLIIDNAETALKAACEKTNASIREYSAAPIFMKTDQKGGHQWLIEFDKAPNDLQQFTNILDDTLKTVNSDYEAKRYKSMSLDIPQVIVARQGLFYEWLKQKGKLGGQNKVPRLANHREYMDELLKLNASDNILNE
jgi:hypothetical protein